MKRFAQWLMVLCGLAFAAGAGAAQFYVFPLKEIAGVSAQARASYPLLDNKVMSMLFDGAAGQQTHAQLIEQLVARLNEAYPTSLVHPRQVFDVKVGSGHRFVDDDSLQCKSSPSVAVGDTYAVVLGITRASLYEVEKGGNIEVLVPVTLNLQFVRPSLGKVVYTVNETVYSPFRFTREEYQSGAGQQIIRDTLVRNVGQLAASLVKSAQQSFNPRDEEVTIVGRDSGLYVTSRGADAGFVKGEQLEASDAKGELLLFDVMYADLAYAVLKPVHGKAAVGDRLKFTFESKAGTGNKPRVMPVLSGSGGDELVSTVADLFSKNLGFKASFQLEQVDVNFAQTKLMITRSANCVNWSNVAGMAESTRANRDAPDYFLRFTPVMTPSVTLSGSTGSRSAEMFHTLVTAQLVDQFGRVVYSGMGDDDYTIDRVGGEGLSLPHARAISLKNASAKLAENFVAQVRFAPRDFQIVKVDKERLWIGGFDPTAIKDKPSFDVLRKLDVSIGGKPALLDLDVSGGGAELAAENGLLGVPYSLVNPELPKPRQGDLLRMKMSTPVGTEPAMDCDEPLFAPPSNQFQADYMAALVRHAIYKSSKFSVHVGDPAFYADVNKFLGDALFDMRIQRKDQPICFQPGYAIREQSLQCSEPNNCKAQVTMALVARLRREGQAAKPYGTAVSSEFSGFPALSKTAFYLYRKLGVGLSMQAELINKLNSN